MPDVPLLGAPPYDDWIKGKPWDFWYHGERITTAEQLLAAYGITDAPKSEQRRRIARLMKYPSAQRGMPDECRAGLERLGLL